MYLKQLLWCALNSSLLLISQYNLFFKIDLIVNSLYSLLSPPPCVFGMTFRCPRRAFYTGMVYMCLEYCPPCFSDDDNSEEGLTTIHSGRHEYAFSLELPQT